MIEFKVLVCGGRDYGRKWTGTQWDEDERQIDRLFAVLDKALQAARLAKRSFVPIRNQKMLTSENPDVIIAFKGGNGTAHMIKIGKEAGVPVYEVK